MMVALTLYAARSLSFLEKYNKRLSSKFHGNQCLALGVFIVIVTAGIDLSVGSILMLSLMVLAITSKAGAAWYIVILIPIVNGNFMWDD